MSNLPGPPNYQFKPLTHQFDDGFGIIGDAFNDAALRLEHSSDQERFFNSSLPIAYLFRHAIELYLKSIIIVLHRNLQIPFGPNPPIDTPRIRINEKWVPINRVHNVAHLHRHFEDIMAKHMNHLQASTSTDWGSISLQLGDWLTAVENIDRQSTFFRYPGAGDALKSDFKESTIGDIWSRMAPDDPPSKAYIEFNANDEVVGAFRMESSELEAMKDILREAANELSAIHFAIRCELAGGM